MNETKVTEVRHPGPSVSSSQRRGWHHVIVTANSTPRIETDWLTLPDLVEALDEPLGRVRRLLDEGHLIASRRDGTLKVPAVFVVDGHPLGSLRGTVTVLHDAGFTDDEAIDWLLEEEDSIGVAPITALLAGRKSEVRRVAQTLA